MRLPTLLSGTVLVLVMLAVVPAKARSRARAIRPAAASLRPVSDCPALFGRAERRAENARARQRIYWVQEQVEGITIAHSSELWSEPVEVSVRGLQLVGARPGLGVVRVSASLGAALRCPAGEYAVGQDDEVGRGGRVLAVLQAGLLLERAGHLAYLRAPGVSSPQWLMAWSAPGNVRVPEGVAESD